jgi:hypothetical protein
MDSFPLTLTPENRNLFSIYKLSSDLSKLRQQIFDYMVSGDTRGFDLKSSTDSNGQYQYSTKSKEIVQKICDELLLLGWKTKVSYGDTTLFIFKDKKELPLMSEMEEIE